MVHLKSTLLGSGGLNSEIRMGSSAASDSQKTFLISPAGFEQNDNYDLCHCYVYFCKK